MNCADERKKVIDHVNAQANCIDHHEQFFKQEKECYGGISWSSVDINFTNKLSQKNALILMFVHDLIQFSVPYYSSLFISSFSFSLSLSLSSLSLSLSLFSSHLGLSPVKSWTALNLDSVSLQIILARECSIKSHSWSVEILIIVRERRKVLVK